MDCLIKKIVRTKKSQLEVKSSWDSSFNRFFKSSIYYISLGKPKFNNLNNVLCYKRKGNDAKGLKIIFNKNFQYGGQDITVKDFNKMFKNYKNSDNLWAFQINTFTWLRDLAEVGTNDARICARKLITAWIKENSKLSERNFQIDNIGKRLFYLTSYYDFYGQSSDNNFKKLLFTSIHKQENFLKKSIKKSKEKIGYKFFKGIKGLIFANIYFTNNKERLSDNLKLLKKNLDSQVLIDGGHITRNSFLSFKILRSLLDIEYILKNSKEEVPAFMNYYIQLITKFTKSILYRDGKLPVFNNSFEYEVENIKDTFKKLNFRIKTVNSFPITGYEKIQAKKTNVLISTATNNKENRHFGVGSFEMQDDKNRMIVNCGACIYKVDSEEALQQTVAHSALNLNSQNNLASDAKIIRRKNKESTSLFVENNGYENNIISRKILVSDDGKTVVGKEVIKNKKAQNFEIRFHLHPDVKVSFTKSNKHLLLKVGKKSAWIFKTSEQKIFIEDSIYFGKNIAPQQTKQIVLRDKIKAGENIIQWLFEKQN